MQHWDRNFDAKKISVTVDWKQWDPNLEIPTQSSQ